MEIAAKTLTSSLTTLGEETDLAYFKKLKSDISDWGKLGIAKAKSVIKEILKHKALFQITETDKKGAKNFLKLVAKGLYNVFKRTPVGGWLDQKTGVKGVVISVAKNPAGWIQGGMALLAAGGGLFLANQAGMSPVNLMSSTLNFGEVVYNFNFQVTDKELEAQIKALVDGMYGEAGDFLGRSIAQLIVGGLTTPPKVVINVRGLALCWLLNEEIRDDLLQNVSQFAHQGIYVARQIAFKFAFLKGRQAIKTLWKQAPSTYKGLLKKIWPDVDKQIENWGKEGNKPWSIATHIEEKVEKIEDKRLQDFTENFLESFWDSFRDSLEYVYN